jgi:hypothetical protein
MGSKVTINGYYNSGLLAERALWFQAGSVFVLFSAIFAGLAYVRDALLPPRPRAEKAPPPDFAQRRVIEALAAKEARRTERRETAPLRQATEAAFDRMLGDIQEEANIPPPIPRSTPPVVGLR